MEPETSLFVSKLKDRIVKTLQDRYRRTGRNDPISWRAIWIELGATEEEFRTALNAATSRGGPAQIVFTDDDHIKLPLRGTALLQPSRPQQVTSASLSSGEHFRFWRRVASLFRPRSTELDRAID